MSRLKLWFFTLLSITAFIVTLAIVAPPLAIVPVGFTVIYMPALAFSFFVAWAFSGIKWGNALVMVATCAFLFTGFLVMGSVLAAFIALVVTLAVYSIHKRSNRNKVKPRHPWPETDTTRFVYPGTQMGYKLNPETAARQVQF